jgi:hypothetical protein
LGAIAFVQKSGEKLMTKRLTDEEIFKQQERLYEQGTHRSTGNFGTLKLLKQLKLLNKN